MPAVIEGPALEAPPYPAVMTPDSSEGRERMARLEVQVDANRRQIETFAPLVLQVERVQWGLDELASDLKQFREDAREQRAADDKKRADELHDLRRGLSDQILVIADGLKGCSTKIGEVADAQRAWQESERQRRDDESKAEKVERTQDVISRRALYGVLGAAALAACAAIIAPILSAIFG